MTDAAFVRREYERAEELRRRGIESQAETAFRQVVELGRALEGPEGLAWAAAAASGLGVVLRYSGRFGEAAAACRDAIALGEKSGPGDGLAWAARAAHNLGVLDADAGRNAGSENRWS